MAAVTTPGALSGNRHAHMCPAPEPVAPLPWPQGLVPLRQPPLAPCPAAPVIGKVEDLYLKPPSAGHMGAVAASRAIETGVMNTKGPPRPCGCG